MSTAAIVLAGGHSTRLGRDKASLSLLGVPLLDRVLRTLDGVVDERIVVARQGQDLSWLDCPAVRAERDLHANQGPLGGLYTGMRATAASTVVAVACDAPLLSRALMSELLLLLPGHDAVVPVCDGMPQPLCASYASRCVDAIHGRLERGELRLSALLEELDVRYMPPDEWRRFDSEGLSFLNLNRQEDVDHAEAVLRRRV